MQEARGDIPSATWRNNVEESFFYYLMGGRAGMPNLGITGLIKSYYYLRQSSRGWFGRDGEYGMTAAGSLKISKPGLPGCSYGCELQQTAMESPMSGLNPSAHTQRREDTAYQPHEKEWKVLGWRQLSMLQPPAENCQFLYKVGCQQPHLYPQTGPWQGSRQSSNI